MSRKTWLWIWIAYGVLRWVLLTSPGYVYDTAAYKRWALAGARHGLTRVYERSDMDYPPLYAYILTPLAALHDGIHPPEGGATSGTTLLTMLIKLPPLLFDVLIALILSRLARRGGPGLEKGSLRWTCVLPALYLLNPAVLFNQGYWGQPDSIHSFFILAAFAGGAWGLARSGVPGKADGGGGDQGAWGVWPAWVLLALATCMKPLGAPFFPLLLALSLVLAGVRRTIAGAGAAALTVVAIFLPFLASGNGAAVLRRVLGDIGIMAYTSTNAHNLWWLLGPWRDSEAPWLGPITSTQVALSLFALAYVAILKSAWRERRESGGWNESQILLLASAVAFSFFMLSTQMHENHMFFVIPLWAALAIRGKLWIRLYVAGAVAVFLNLLLHDLVLPARFPFTAGGSVGVINPHLKRPFFAGELAAIWISTAFNLGLYAWFMFHLLRRGPRNLLTRLRGRAVRPS